MSVGTQFTAKKREKFLAMLAETANITRSARAVGVSRIGAYKVKAADPEFAKAWADAIEAGTEQLEAEAYRRAFKGTKRPIYQGGRLCGHVQEFSDTLTIFLLKGAKPEKYRDRVEHSGSVEKRVRFIFGKSKKKGGE